MNSILGKGIQNLNSFVFELPQGLLVELEGIEFVEIGDLVVAKGNYQSTAEPVCDPTFIECLANKWHIDDIIQVSKYSESDVAKLGVCFALELRKKLQATLIRGEFRSIVSVTDPQDNSVPHGCTVRCHKLRPSNPWLREDLDGYRSEALMVIDWIDLAENAQVS